MGIVRNTHNVQKVYRGATPIIAIYRGSNLVFSGTKTLPKEYQQVEYMEGVSRYQHLLDMSYIGVGDIPVVGKYEGGDIEKDGVVVARLVPCYRIADCVGGFYDIINKMFVPNSISSREFIFGADIYADKLPSDYERVEYIYSDGNQYFDTGILVTSDLYIRGRIISNGEETSSSLSACGGITTSSNIRHHSIVNNATQKLLYYYGPTSVTVDFPFGTWGMMSYNNGLTAVVGGYKRYYKDVGTIDFPTDPHYGLFVRFTTAGLKQATPCGFSNFIMERNGEIIRKYVACIRKADNKPGMYDFATKTFFTNEGTGDFSYMTLDGVYHN